MERNRNKNTQFRPSASVNYRLVFERLCPGFFMPLVIVTGPSLSGRARNGNGKARNEGLGFVVVVSWCTYVVVFSLFHLWYLGNSTCSPKGFEKQFFENVVYCGIWIIMFQIFPFFLFFSFRRNIFIIIKNSIRKFVPGHRDGTRNKYNYRKGDVTQCYTLMICAQRCSSDALVSSGFSSV